jgi:hypothetical protein
MRILLKCPTRSRPTKVVETLKKYVALAKRKDMIGVAVSCDDNDSSMTRNSIQQELHGVLGPVAWHRLFFSPNRTKIQACNANMDEIDYPWDIVVLVSDDMIPQIAGWDDVIRNHMAAYFPDTRGILWFNDGCQGEKLNTLCIFGRKMYESFGHIYEPAYKSLFCDTELTDRCRADLAPFCRYVSYCIIRHEHPGTGYAQNMDTLYAKNQTYWNDDMYTYIARKTYEYDWSVLIPTMTGREAGLRRLVESIREKVGRICPDTRVEFCLAFDNRETSVGLKRQQLIQNAKGRYSSFIDDDDDITDAYVEDVVAMIRGGYPVMRLRGQISQYTFTHSLENTLQSPMAVGEVFLRPPNHLNPIMTDVAKFVHYKDAIRGEDLDWMIRMSQSGFLTNEYRSDPSRIHYIYNMGDRIVTSGTLENQQNTNYMTMLSMVWTPGGAVAPQPPQQQVGPLTLRLGPKGFVSA